jgi:hypothetical protein
MPTLATKACHSGIPNLCQCHARPCWRMLDMLGDAGQAGRARHSGWHARHAAPHFLIVLYAGWRAPPPSMPTQNAQHARHASIALPSCHRACPAAHPPCPPCPPCDRARPSLPYPSQAKPTQGAGRLQWGSAAHRSNARQHHGAVLLCGQRIRHRA